MEWVARLAKRFWAGRGTLLLLTLLVGMYIPVRTIGTSAVSMQTENVDTVAGTSMTKLRPPSTSDCQQQGLAAASTFISVTQPKLPYKWRGSIATFCDTDPKAAQNLYSAQVYWDNAYSVDFSAKPADILGELNTYGSDIDLHAQIRQINRGHHPAQFTISTAHQFYYIGRMAFTVVIQKKSARQPWQSFGGGFALTANYAEATVPELDGPRSNGDTSGRQLQYLIMKDTQTGNQGDPQIAEYFQRLLDRALDPWYTLGFVNGWLTPVDSTVPTDYDYYRFDAVLPLYYQNRQDNHSARTLGQALTSALSTGQVTYPARMAIILTLKGDHPAIGDPHISANQDSVPRGPIADEIAHHARAADRLLGFLQAPQFKSSILDDVRHSAYALGPQIWKVAATAAADQIVNYTSKTLTQGQDALLYLATGVDENGGSPYESLLNRAAGTAILRRMPAPLVACRNGRPIVEKDHKVKVDRWANESSYLIGNLGSAHNLHIADKGAVDNWIANAATNTFYTAIGLGVGLVSGPGATAYSLIVGVTQPSIPFVPSSSDPTAAIASDYYNYRYWSDEFLALLLILRRGLYSSNSRMQIGLPTSGSIGALKNAVRLVAADGDPSWFNHDTSGSARAYDLIGSSGCHTGYSSFDHIFDPMNSGLPYTGSHVLGTTPGLSPHIRTAARLDIPRAKVATMGFNRHVAIKAPAVSIAGTAFNRYLRLTFALYSCDSISCSPGLILRTVPKTVTVDGNGHFSAQMELPSEFRAVTNRHYYIAVLATGALKVINEDTARGDVASGLSRIAHGARLDDTLPLVGLVRDGIFGAMTLNGFSFTPRVGVSTLAGAAVPYYSGDGGPATEAGLRTTASIATDNVGDLAMVDLGNGIHTFGAQVGVVRLVDHATGIISTLTARIGSHRSRIIANGVALDRTGRTLYAVYGTDLYHVDLANGDAQVVHLLPLLGPLSRVITVYPYIDVDGQGRVSVAIAMDKGAFYFCRYDPASDAATLFAKWEPNPAAKTVDIRTSIYGGIWGLANDPAGDLFVGDHFGIKEIDRDTKAISMVFTTIQSTRPITTATGTPIPVIPDSHTSFTIDASGALYLASYEAQSGAGASPLIVDITRYDRATGAATVIVHSSNLAHDLVDPVETGGGAPASLALDGHGHIFIPTGADGGIDRLDIATKRLVRAVGSPRTGKDSINASALASDGHNHVAVVEMGGDKVVELDTATRHEKIIATAATMPAGGQSGASATIEDAAYGPDGTLYIADGAGAIDAIGPGGKHPTLFARIPYPTGPTPHVKPQGGGGSEPMAGPYAIAVDHRGDVFADYANRVWEWPVAARHHPVIVAGNGRDGETGDGGPAARAAIGGVRALAVDGNNTLYILSFPNAIRRVDTRTGQISTVIHDQHHQANDAVNGYGALAIDHQGTLYVTDTDHAVVLRIDPKSGSMCRVAGVTDMPGFDGDSHPPTETLLSSPVGLAVDGRSDLIVGDVDNGRVRLIAMGRG